ncbi:Six-bladed beta-propeller, TolB-like protein [Akanthomyces lecanii RCEF 1005]|uniref:Six-bladed beta-propeller, TolB-like protein n=1 Tax=Akanthomyces lecanii RCEF 1005 TaxID=1081108 RepID=A0A162KB82_CORDF|nr:Six-bladed beta-propeller, TolB-like protein [Akanthomyces lecanii RCEF 1005]
MADTNKPSPFDRELAEALCSLEIPKQIKFSPDGQKIVYTTSFQSGGLRKGKHATSKLWLASASGPGSARPLTSGKTRDNSPAWHPDGNRVAFLSDRGDPRSGRAIWMLRLDGGDAVQISDSGSKSSIARFAFSPNGDNGGATDPAVWGQDTSQHARLRLLDVKTRETRTLDTGKGLVIEFHWSSDGTSVIVGTVANMDSEEVFMTGTTIATVAVESGEKTEVCVAGVLGESLTWAPDGKVYFIDTPV